MKITATIQARTGSSRLPGKVLLPIIGKPMLELQIERVRHSRLIDEIVIATSTNPQDDAIEQLARRCRVGCFRGSEEDVLGRVVSALKSVQAELHVELMGDSPLSDPLLIDACIGYYLKHAGAYDYVTTGLTTTFPPGMEVTIYPARILIDAERLVTDASLREHVSCHITQHPERYRLCNLEAPRWFRYPDYYLEVDAPEDFEVIASIFEHLYPTNPGFGLAQIIDFLNAHPALAARNRSVERRWRAFRRDQPLVAEPRCSEPTVAHVPDGGRA